MNPQIEKHLDFLCRQDLEAALFSIRELFGNYYQYCVKNVSILEIDAWVNQHNNSALSSSWKHQKNEMMHPLLFLKRIFSDSKYATLRTNQYQRLIHAHTPQNTSNSRGISTEDISNFLITLPFYEAWQYLGELVAAWMLTYPAASIKTDPNKQLIDQWEKMFMEQGKIPDNEKELLWELDYSLFLYLDTWYDEENLFKQ